MSGTETNDNGRTIVIVHAGEDCPIDNGYVPLRYGRLALELQSRGDHVIRIGPTFSHLRRAQRTAGVHRSEEGTHVLVPTCGYTSSFDPQRARYYVQLVRGALREIRARRNEIGAVVLGVPPPGIVSAVRSVLGPDVPIVADVRDLWPEAFAVGKHQRFMAAASVGGTIFSQDLRSADAITAVTQPMLDWAPSIDAKRHVIPIGLEPKPLDGANLPSADAPLQLCFLSNHSHGFDFEPVFTAWQRYCSTLEPSQSVPKLGFIGCEPSTQIEHDIATNDPTIHLMGRLLPAEVAPALSAFDIGLAPSSPEWAHSLGNKIFDYLSAGLFVLHSIHPTAIAEVERLGLSSATERSSEDWLRAFNDAHQRRAAMRTERHARIASADAAFGRSATAGAMIELIDDAINASLPAPDSTKPTAEATL